MPATLATHIRDAAHSLASVTDTPRLDAETLLAHALDMTRARLLASLQDLANPSKYDSLVARRAAGEPLAYILGEWEFFSRNFLVHAPVLVPRPETEHLVECVIESGAGERADILDLGTGSGCVAVTLAIECSGVSICASDIRPGNLELARRNAVLHEVESSIRFVECDLFDSIEGPFDVICSNPPYVAGGDWPRLSKTIREYEDTVALLSGPDGLDCIRRLIADSPTYLRPKGLLAFEFGAGQRPAIEDLLCAAGYGDIRFIRDLAGLDRIASARKPG